jgi:hypothetical protein
VRVKVLRIRLENCRCRIFNKKIAWCFSRCYC